MIAHIFVALSVVIVAAICAFGAIAAVDMRRYGWAALLASLTGGLVATCVAILLRLLGGE